jgi:branched-chain amino acid transport system substrate-binding protein
MDLALGEDKMIKVLYEDSRSAAQDGISAFNNLSTKNVDLMVSELSLISVPLSKLANDRKIPLLVSLVAADRSKIVNDYTIRYYTNPLNYAEPAFIDPVSPLNSRTKIAVLTRNDELGESVKDKIANLSAQYGKQIVFKESFALNEKDFRTTMSKIKKSGAEAIIFVVANPVEAVGVLKSAREMGVNVPLIESSAVFADLGTRKQVEGISFYSTSYDFNVASSSDSFKKSYKERFGVDPNFGAAFGFDVANLIKKCVTKKDDFRNCIYSIPSINGMAGTANQLEKGDFSVQLHLEKVN